MSAGQGFPSDHFDALSKLDAVLAATEQRLGEAQELAIGCQVDTIDPQLGNALTAIGSARREVTSVTAERIADGRTAR